MNADTARNSIRPGDVVVDGDDTPLRAVHCWDDEPVFLAFGPIGAHRGTPEDVEGADLTLVRYGNIQHYVARELEGLEDQIERFAEHYDGEQDHPLDADDVMVTVDGADRAAADPNPLADELDGLDDQLDTGGETDAEETTASE